VLVVLLEAPEDVVQNIEPNGVWRKLYQLDVRLILLHCDELCQFICSNLKDLLHLAGARLQIVFYDAFAENEQNEVHLRL
jgi:hypothetical protein